MTFELIRTMLFILFVLVTIPILCVFIWLNELMDRHGGLKVLQTILGFFGFASYLGLGWLADVTARRMVFENMSLVPALRSAVQDVRLALGFIPGVGRWFVTRSDDRPSDDNRPIE